MPSEAYSSECGCSTCDYRSLYEGTMHSLSEMASNQRRSLERLGRARAALASLLLQNFPFKAREVERGSGRRISDLTEDELSAVLGAAIKDKGGKEAEMMISEMVSALRRLGLELPEDRSTWVAIMRAEAGHAGEDVIAEAERPAPTKNAPERPVSLPVADREEPPRTDLHSGPMAPLFASRDKVTASETHVDAARSRAEDTSPAFDGGKGTEPSERSSPTSPEDPAPAATHSAQENDDSVELRPPATLFQSPLRPGMPDRKRPAARTAPASSSGGSIPAAALTDSIRSALREASFVPRPVFTSDLVSVVNSEDLVNEWEAECRSNAAESPVRFIAPKSRHRHRGRLVVPADNTSTSPKDWWSRCVAMYRAGRLYELAVVLRHLGDSILSVQLEEDFALIRQKGEGGVSAVLLALSPLPKGEEASMLEPVLASLAEERLDAIILLSASGEKDARESLSRAASRAITGAGLDISVPIVASVSWEYVDDSKSSAVFVRS